MREWNLSASDPLSLIIAADARLAPTDYTDDQIWELRLSGGDPPSLALFTTYGLRARAMRLFPRFIEGDSSVTDPVEFVQAPVVEQFYPNYLRLSYSPFEKIEIISEYWALDSHAVSGRLHFTNQDERSRSLSFEWVALLTPTEGERMAPGSHEAVDVLCGSTGGLAPVVFLTGGAKPGSSPFPCLRLDLELQAGQTHTQIWSHAARPTTLESFEIARQVAQRSWEAEIARIEMLNSGQVEIYTGNPDWDAAFALSQKTAYQLFVGPAPGLPQPSFVLTRQPDNGYSLRGDGSDYNHLWNGQTPLEACYLADILLPHSPDLITAVLDNFLSTQGEDGALDHKPGLAGQRLKTLAAPYLARLAWRVYESTQDRAFVNRVFPGLLRFVQAWFTPLHDRDGDGVPEWDTSLQASYEDHPIFSAWQTWSQGLLISTAESPALIALLHRECRSLLNMAALLEQSEPVSALQSIAEHLETALQTGWDEQLSTYWHWDRDTHHSPPGELLGERLGPGGITISRQFEVAVRLLVHIENKERTTRRPIVLVHGSNISGQHRVERLGEDQFRWYHGRGTVTGERVYTELERVEIQNVSPQDRVTLYSAGFRCSDHALLLPLWAGLPSQQQAVALVENKLTDPQSYWRPYGIPAFPQSPETADPDVCLRAHIPWNALVGEGLVAYGYRSQAAQLVARLMEAQVKILKTDKGFRQYTHTRNGEGLGERNHLAGLAPVGLFLQVLGVRLDSPRQVALAGFNPFSWPVTVKYRGLTVLRQREKSTVIFPDGQTVEVSDPTPQIVSLSDKLEAQAMVRTPAEIHSFMKAPTGPLQAGEPHSDSAVSTGERTASAGVERVLGVVVQLQDLKKATRALEKLGLSVIHLPSTGAFLGRRNVTLLVPLPSGFQAAALQAIQESCHQRIEYVSTPLEGAPIPIPLSTPITVGGATIFSLEVERYEEL